MGEEERRGFSIKASLAQSLGDVVTGFEHARQTWNQAVVCFIGRLLLRYADLGGASALRCHTRRIGSRTTWGLAAWTNSTAARDMGRRTPRFHSFANAMLKTNRPLTKAHFKNTKTRLNHDPIKPPESSERHSLPKSLVNFEA
ncbi:hypothetical protein CVT25_006235 [Psilocybe cyanescens]|uniref:Uncharacterized protein n=1 Tax=Psilocybe cyanescens TaxID=93625 RepID=A0A409XKK1_PSICY|nr:hypothetical protein CVT25_006235 [Psilocybe cyanescens]